MNPRLVLLLFGLTCLLRLPAQNVIVTGALVGNGSYADLGAAFAAINGGAQTGATIFVNIVANTNEGSVSAVLDAGTLELLPLHGRQV
jgi:hypothetical protein